MVMELRKSPSRSIVQMELSVEQATYKLQALLHEDISNKDIKLLVPHAASIKKAYTNYHEKIHAVIEYRISHGCISVANSLKNDRKLLKDEVSEAIGIINGYLGDDENISDIASLSSSVSATLHASKVSSNVLSEEGLASLPQTEQISKVEEFVASGHAIQPEQPSDLYEKLIETTSAVATSETGTRPKVSFVNNPITSKYSNYETAISNQNAQTTCSDSALVAQSLLPTTTAVLTHSLPVNLISQSPLSNLTLPQSAAFPIVSCNISTIPVTHFSFSNSFPQQIRTPNSFFTPLSTVQAGIPSVFNPQTCTVGSNYSIPIQSHTYIQPQSGGRLFQYSSIGDNIDSASAHLLRQNLLKVPATPYNGEPYKFRAFINQLNANIKGVPLSNWDMMCILNSHTSGKPQKIIQSFMTNGSNDPEEAMKDIEEDLVRKFGSGTTIANSLINKLDSLPPIKDLDQIDKLEELLEVCKVIKTNLSFAKELQIFENSQGILRIWQKLPAHFQQSWRSKCREYKDNNASIHPPFSVFLEFLKKKVREYDDPTYSRKQNFEKPKQLKEHRNFKTVADAPPDSNEGKFMCPVHQSSKHDIKECRSFIKCTIDEKNSIIRENGLCYRCLGKHIKANCTEKPKCDRCGKLHLTILHRGGFPSEPQSQLAPNESDPKTLCTKLCGNKSTYRSCTKTLLVDITWPGQSTKTLRCYCIIDEQSD